MGPEMGSGSGTRLACTSECEIAFVWRWRLELRRERPLKMRCSIECRWPKGCVMGSGMGTASGKEARLWMALGTRSGSR